MTPPVRILDPEDPRIAVYRQVRERDLAGRDCAFIAEGEVVLNALARSPLHRAGSVLIAEKRLARLAPVIERLGSGVAVYTAAQPVMDAIAGFPIHRGILAWGERGPSFSAHAVLEACPAECVVLALF